MEEFLRKHNRVLERLLKLLDPTSRKFWIRTHSLGRGLPMLADGQSAFEDHGFFQSYFYLIFLEVVFVHKIEDIIVFMDVDNISTVIIVFISTFLYFQQKNICL